MLSNTKEALRDNYITGPGLEDSVNLGPNNTSTPVNSARKTTINAECGQEGNKQRKKFYLLSHLISQLCSHWECLIFVSWGCQRDGKGLIFNFINNVLQFKVSVTCLCFKNVNIPMYRTFIAQLSKSYYDKQEYMFDFRQTCSLSSQVMLATS